MRNYYRKPLSDNQRLTFLQRALSTGMEDLAAGKAFLRQETLDAIEELLPQFETVVKAVSISLSARTTAIRERIAATDQVEIHVRDLLASIKRQVRRMDLPAEVLQFYELPLSGTVPKPASQEEWLTLAIQVVEGDAAAVAAGHPPAVGPSAAELQAVLKDAQSKVTTAALADRAYDEAQKAASVLRPHADDLIAEVVGYLRFTLRDLDAPSRRRIMRSYGVRFRGPGNGGEPEEDPLVDLLDDAEAPAEPAPQEEASTELTETLVEVERQEG